MKKITKELNELGISNYTIRKDGVVDVAGDVRISELYLTEIPIQFGYVTGIFDCSNNKLKTSNGFPLRCSVLSCGNNLLDNLVHCPKVVKEIYCASNRITTLKHCKICKESIQLIYCHNNCLSGKLGIESHFGEHVQVYYTTGNDT